MRYPKTARENGIEGKVIVGFTIDRHGAISNYRIKNSLGYGCDEEGLISNYRIKNSLGYGCDEEGLKAVKRVEGEWLPGLLNGKPVDVEYELPLSFTMGN